MMKLRLMLVSAMTLALLVGVATASASGGNSDAAKACQNGGWQHLYRLDGTGFKNEGDCVSYAAKGGVFVGLGSQSDCQTFGGVYSLGTSYPVQWSCDGWTNSGSSDYYFRLDVLNTDCAADGFVGFIPLPLFTPNIPGTNGGACVQF